MATLGKQLQQGLADAGKAASSDVVEGLVDDGKQTRGEAVRGLGRREGKAYDGGRP